MTGAAVPTRRGTAIGLAAVGMLLAAAAGAHDSEHAAAGEAAAPTGSLPAAVSIMPPDPSLLDRHGEPVRFASEVLDGRIVVMDFIYTSCTTVCPVLSAIMRQVSDDLATEYGEAVRLVSVTVDPGQDTPQRLQQYAERLGAGADWRFVTGPKNSIDEVRRAMGAYTPNYDDHPPVLLVGDAASGHWYRFYGFAAPERLLTAVDRLHAQRSAAAGVAQEE